MGRTFQEGTYELVEQSNGATSKTIKVFMGGFDPPEESEAVLAIAFSECAPRL